ncbi:hypothetical protein EDB19DRAFT_1715646 [Suillus lakei]|nr:hypothetical protein EDB19DRAFT_1715646 [Suillus lakei]
MFRYNQDIWSPRIEMTRALLIFLRSLTMLRAAQSPCHPCSISAFKDSSPRGTRYLGKNIRYQTDTGLVGRGACMCARSRECYSCSVPYLSML